MALADDIRDYETRKEELDELKSDIVYRIRGGETTGNPALDFDFAWFPTGTNMLSTLTRLKQQVDSGIGGLVLVAEYCCEVRSPPRLFFMQIGYLSSGSEFDCAQGNIVLPMDSHVWKEGGELTKQAGGIFLNGKELDKILDYMVECQQGMYNNDYGLFIGEPRIREFLDSASPGLLDTAKRLLQQ
jgi:hypothetical protein